MFHSSIFNFQFLFNVCRCSLTCFGNFFLLLDRCFFSIALSLTPLLFSESPARFVFFFLQDSGFGCFFLNTFRFGVVSSVSSTPSFLFMAFSLFTSTSPKLTVLSIFLFENFRLASDGCSNTGVRLCKYRIGCPGFERNLFCRSRSCVAMM